MNEHVEVVVVGGGVIGGSIAYHLARGGRRVLLLERERIASGASSAAAGMLGAQSEMEEAGPLYDLARRSRAMFPRIAEELRELTGIDIGLVQKGLLKIALDAEQAEACRRMIEFQRRSGEQATWLAPREAQELEPRLSPQIAGAVRIPGDGQVSAPDTARAFVQAAAALGAEVREYAEVKSLRIEGGRVTGVVTDGGTIGCDRVVVASGVQGRHLLAQVGVTIDVFPVKGECFSVLTRKPLVTSSIFSHGCYIVPKRGGRLVVGATMVPHAYDRTVSAGGLASLMGKAAALVPDIAAAEWETAWAGLRPQTRDGLPYLGRTAACRDLYVAQGHYRNGILLSPATGWLLAELMDGNPEADEVCLAFSADRHSGAGDASRAASAAAMAASASADSRGGA